MKTRILSILLCVLMLVSMMPLSVSAVTTVVDSTDDLQAVINSATAGAVIQLGANFDGAITIGSTTDITLDLNGKTLSSNVSTVTVDGGKLTVMDSVGTGKIVTSDNSGNCEAVAVKNSGTFTLKSGTIQGLCYGIYAYTTGGNIFVEGGKVEVTNTDSSLTSIAIAVGNGKATITGGEIARGAGWTVYAWSNYGGKAEITGGTFNKSFDNKYLGTGYTQIENNGVYTVQRYISLKDLFDAASAGDTITLTEAGIYSWPSGYTLPDGVTIKGAVDGVVVTNGPVVRGKDLTVDNVDFIASSNVAVIFKTSGDSVFKNCKIAAPYGTWDQWGSGAVNGTLLIDNCDITGTYYALHIGSGNGTVTVKNSALAGWNSFGSSLTKVNFVGCAFSSNGTGNDWDAMLRVYGDAEIKNSTFTPDMIVESRADDANDALKIEDCTMTDGSSIVDIINIGALGDTELVLWFDVTFVNGSTSTTNKVQYNDKVTKPADPVWEGNTFLGWYVGDTAYDFNAPVVSDLVLTAKWDVDSYNLICMDDTAVLSTTPYDYGSAITAPADPTRDGYTFAGWVDADGNPVAIPATMPAKDVVIYASWSKNQIAMDPVLFSLAARYAQRFDVLVSAENATVTGDTTIKYKRTGTVEISVAEGYQLVDVIANGQSLGAVTSVTFKKVMGVQTLVIVTEPIPTEEPVEETPAA